MHENLYLMSNILNMLSNAARRATNDINQCNECRLGSSWCWSRRLCSTIAATELVMKRILSGCIKMNLKNLLGQKYRLMKALALINCQGITSLVKKEKKQTTAFNHDNKGSTEIYTAIWTFLQQRVPNCKNVLQTAVTNWDPPIVTSLRKSFPLIHLRGTWTQIIRNFTRHWRRLHLPQRLQNEVLRQSWALPLLPFHRFQEAIVVISATSEEIEDNYENIAVFIRYLQKCGLHLRDAISVYGRPSYYLSNNIDELLQRFLRKCGGEFPSLYTFLDQLDILVTTSDAVFNRINRPDNDEGVPPVDERIALRLDLLAGNRITVKDFLNDTIDRYHHDLLLMAINRDIHRESKEGVGNLHDLKDPEELFVGPNVFEALPGVPGPSGLGRRHHRAQRRNIAPYTRLPTSLIDLDSSDDDREDLSRAPTVLIDPLENDNEPIPICNDTLSVPDVQEPRDCNHDVDDPPADHYQVRCCFCLLNQPRAAFVPCGHRCVCLECQPDVEASNQESLQNDRDFTPHCPICNQSYNLIMRVYDS